MKPDQLTLRELLKDPTYRKWFSRNPPSNSLQQMPGEKPWRLYVQKVEGGKWQRGEVRTYRSAYEHARKLLAEGAYDLTIFSKRRSYGPPKDYEWPTSHDWCPYCRRPTVFWRFRRHHALMQWSWLDLSDERRCTICGIRQTDQMVWRWQR